MIGSLLTRLLVMVFGYAYPAYECFKSVEKNKPDMEQLRFWCQYWILVAALTVCDRIGDALISWVPMYSEAKLAFYIYLWYPKTKGTKYVYDSFLRPYISKHEAEIDRTLLELKTRTGDIAALYWQRVISYGQTRVYDVLQCVIAQSIQKPQPSQPAAARQETEEAPPPASSSSSSASGDGKANKTSSTQTSNGVDMMQAEEGNKEDPFRVTRGRLRKTSATMAK